jgi:hypothetical protein
MGGLGWKDMAIEQGLQNIARLIIGMHDEEILGTMTNIMLNQWKWLIGFDPFQHYELQTPHDKSIWLRNIRTFMIEKGIQIKKTVQAYPLLREKDEYLMQKAAQLELDTKEIRFINYCRLYLNVITISDITEPDGIHVRKFTTWIKQLRGDNAATPDVINNSQRSVDGTHGAN